VCACIRKVRSGYYGGVDYELDGRQAIAHLINHPLVIQAGISHRAGRDFARCTPELEIKKVDAHTLRLRLEPAINADSAPVLTTQETPTRLRIIEVTDEHRRIGSILGESLSVPVRAKEQVLDAIRAISSLITIQSDLDVLPSNVPQVEADCQVARAPDAAGPGPQSHSAGAPVCKDAGPYYPPGSRFRKCDRRNCRPAAASAPPS
jgi:hypothetical protein